MLYVKLKPIIGVYKELLKYYTCCFYLQFFEVHFHLGIWNRTEITKEFKIIDWKMKMKQVFFELIKNSH